MTFIGKGFFSNTLYEYSVGVFERIQLGLLTTKHILEGWHRGFNRSVNIINSN